MGQKTNRYNAYIRDGSGWIAPTISQRGVNVKVKRTLRFHVHNKSSDESRYVLWPFCAVRIVTLIISLSLSAVGRHNQCRGSGGQSLCVVAPRTIRPFARCKFLPSHAESFTLPVAAWRRGRKQGGRPWRVGGAFFVVAVRPQPRQATRGVSTRGLPRCMQLQVRVTTDMKRAGACCVDAAQVSSAQVAQRQ